MIIQGSAPAVAPPQTGVPQAVVDGQALATPQAVYEAFRAQRSELRSQLNILNNDRISIAQRLRNGGAAEGADVTGLEKRLEQLDERIIDMQKQIAEADAKVSEAAAVPGAVVTPPRPASSGPPEGAFVVGTVLVVFVFFPIALAYARRIWRRSAGFVTGLPKDFSERIARIEDGVDAMALEVERIGEGQRFVTNLFIEAGPPRSMGVATMEAIASGRPAETARDR